VVLVSAVGRLMAAVTLHWPSAVVGNGVSPSVAEAEEVTEAVTPPMVDSVGLLLLSVQVTFQLIATSSVPVAVTRTDIELGDGMLLLVVRVQA
jgi:hypothetical protein